MKNFIFTVLIAIFFLSPALRAESQTKTDSKDEDKTLEFNMTGFPQWVKDMRRWDIIAFGVFPFAIFFTTVANDLYRWRDANGMSMDDRYYAPWPLKQAGGYEMSKEEFETVLIQAACVSAIVATIDLVIVLIKRSMERKRVESKPKSEAVIEIKPYGVPPEDDSSKGDASKDEKSETDESGKN